jgi:hypothetical protein
MTFSNSLTCHDFYTMVINAHKSSQLLPWISLYNKLESCLLLAHKTPQRMWETNGQTPRYFLFLRFLVYYIYYIKHMHVTVLPPTVVLLTYNQIFITNGPTDAVHILLIYRPVIQYCLWITIFIIWTMVFYWKLKHS